MSALRHVNRIQGINRVDVKSFVRMADIEVTSEKNDSVAPEVAPAVAPPVVPVPALVAPEDFKEYLMCTACKSAFIYGKDALGERGARVRCSVCEKEWFQSSERLMRTGNMHYLSDMSDTKVAEIRQVLADRNFPKYPKVDKVGVFVGNLPYTWTEKEIGDIFGEYGITNIVLVRDNEGQSKGFSFVEVCCVCVCTLLYNPYTPTPLHPYTQVGHGNLAERALTPAIPDASLFPYSIRAESLITESCGSSSMATVCGCCLAMLDAGVPLKTAVAGVAMGLILGEKEGDEPVVLTDILGLEDALGTMDFKIAGNETGITTFQLDIKSEGLTLQILSDALLQVLSPLNCFIPPIYPDTPR